jgi:hypothetical protein
MKQILKIIVPIFFVIGVFYFILYLQDNYYQKTDSYPIIQSPKEIVVNKDTSVFKVFLHSEKETNVIDITIFELEELIENRIRFEVSTKDTIQKNIFGTDLLIADALYVINGMKNNVVMRSSKSLTTTVISNNDTAFVVKKQMIRDYRTQVINKLNVFEYTNVSFLEDYFKNDYSKIEDLENSTKQQIIFEYETPFAPVDVVFKTDSMIYRFLKTQNEYKHWNFAMSSKSHVTVNPYSVFEITKEMIQSYKEEVITNYLNK